MILSRAPRTQPTGPTALINGAFQPVLGAGGQPATRMPPLFTAVPTAPAPAAPPAASYAPPSAVAAAPAPQFAAPSPEAAAAAAAIAAMSLNAAPAAAPAGEAVEGLSSEAAAAVARDHALAVRLQESYEEQERAARKAVRQAASRLQQQQERGAGGEDANDVREFINRVEAHVGNNCSLQ